MTWEGLCDVAAQHRPASLFVWPDEGDFEPAPEGSERPAVFVFNAAHRSGGRFTPDGLNNKRDFEPLLVDMTTAHTMVEIHRGLSVHNQRKLEQAVISGRGEFASMVETCLQIACKYVECERNESLGGHAQ